MARLPKGEFDELDSEYKDGIASMTKEEINNRISEIAKAEAESQAAKKEDQELKEAKLKASVAGEGYRESTKLAKLRIKYCIQILKDRGQE